MTEDRKLYWRKLIEANRVRLDIADWNKLFAALDKFETNIARNIAMQLLAADYDPGKNDTLTFTVPGPTDYDELIETTVTIYEKR